MEVNKYGRCYDRLMARARTREHSKGMERHHVMPRSLGGTNDKANLVSLTYREHFIAHWLLTKFTTGEARTKMRRALLAMTWVSKTHARIVAGWQYEKAREVLPELGRALGKAGKGTKRSDEHKRKIAEALRGRVLSDEHLAKLRLLSPSCEARTKTSAALTGRTYSEPTLAKMRAAGERRRGAKASDETRRKLSAALTGRVVNEEWRQKLSVANKGRRLGPQSTEHKAKIAASAKKRARDSRGVFLPGAVK